MHDVSYCGKSYFNKNVLMDDVSYCGKSYFNKNVLMDDVSYCGKSNNHNMRSFIGHSPSYM